MSANHASLEPSFVKKKESNADEKARIAKAAREHICPGEKIILDSGTTVLELAKLVNDIPDLTVVTNGGRSGTERVQFHLWLFCRKNAGEHLCQ